MEQGVGALTSDYGRAAQAKAQQMQKGGASLDQIQQELYGSVMKGLLPFQVAAELFHQLKQPPKAPAPPPDGTVLTDMAKILAKRSSGVASLPAPTMDEAQFAGGGIVAFAGGDLVPSGGRNYPVVPYREAASKAGALVPTTAAGLAGKASRFGRFLTGKGPWLTAAGIGLSALPFLLGGDDEKVKAEDEKSNTAALREYDIPKDTVPQVGMPSLNVSTAGYDREIARREARLKELTPKEREDYIDQQRQMLEDSGIGEVVRKREEARQMLEDSGIGEVVRKREEALAGRQAEAEQERSKAGLMSLARAGFEMAAAASQPGASFFGSAASGALRGIEDYAASKERLRQTDAAIQDAQFQLAEAGAMRDYAARQGGETLFREAQKTYDDAMAGLSTLVIGRESQINDVIKTQFVASVDIARTNAQLLADAGRNDLARQIAQLVSMSTQAWTKGRTQEAKNLLDRAQEIVNSTSPQILSKEVGLGNMAGAGVNAKEWGETVTQTTPKAED